VLVCKTESLCIILTETVYSPPARRKSVSAKGGMVALVRCRGNVYYQVDERAAAGRKYGTPGSYTTTYRLKTSSS
jgi:hypothetical protein